MVGTLTPNPMEGVACLEYSKVADKALTRQSDDAKIMVGQFFPHCYLLSYCPPIRH